jgi:hypothetical protein
MYSPLDILYIVLAFCVLWITAALFWLLWQIASTIKRVNDTLHSAQDTFCRVQETLEGIRQRFDHTSTALGAVMHTATKAVEYLIEKRLERAAKKNKKT